jgi:formylglycine-generating enzyme required for sulfatase activity
MTPELPLSPNPYVGPRTFSAEQRHLFFGREREARDLLARVLSERLLLFYAQSGAGKSSLLRTRLIPQLQEERGFVVLPVGRVSGELPAGVGQVDNIFVFNLLLSIDEGSDPGRLAHVTLADFLARLTRQAVLDKEGRERKGWGYDADATPAPAAARSRRYALIVDQFEEIITGHPGRWREREDFFRQLDVAMRADPNLWVVLTLREDYVASLDPYAPFVADRLRARFYMERMAVAAALDAIRKPAELADRPFAPGVAEKLADELRQVRMAGQEGTVAGQYVEPVQLQVVCYQLWENLGKGIEGTGGTEGVGGTGGVGGIGGTGGIQITFDDLARAGDVNRALTQFYEETLAAALADPVAAGVSERQLRAWFDKELITDEGTRGLVHQGESEAGGLPNDVVRALQRRFLVRAEARGGDAWIELVHDRFVEPIRASNAAWFPQHLSALQRQAALWDEQGRSSGLLLRDAALVEAETWVVSHAEELQHSEEEFLAACRQAQEAVERERRQSRVIRILAIAAGVVAILAIAAAIWGWWSSNEAARQKEFANHNALQALAAQLTAEASAAEAKRQEGIAADNARKARDAQLTAEASAAEAKRQEGIAAENARKARDAQATAEANAALAQSQLDRQRGLALLQEAYAFKEKGDVQGAIEKFRAAQATGIELGIKVETEIEDVRRQVAIRLVQEGEALAKEGDFAGAEARFKAALSLEPPPDTPLYVYVPAGAFFMGEDMNSAFTGTLPAYWIQRTEVTNAQYQRCVKAKGCEPPYDGNVRYQNPQFANQPVAGIDWIQARNYAAWAGGRLPTEAEWEKACRGGLEIPQNPLVGWGQMTRNDQMKRSYPWGEEDPTGERLNFWETGLGTWSMVGSYPKGASPYGALDMAGNVWEWTSSAYADYPYDPGDGREEPGAKLRVLRGGSFDYIALYVGCTVRYKGDLPVYWFDNVGFRVVMSPGS